MPEPSDRTPRPAPPPPDNTPPPARHFDQAGPQTLAGILLHELGFPADEIRTMEIEELATFPVTELFPDVDILTRDQVTAAIEHTVRAIADGTVDATRGRVILFGLQTLTVAMRYLPPAKTAPTTAPPRKRRAQRPQERPPRKR